MKPKDLLVHLEKGNRTDEIVAEESVAPSNRVTTDPQGFFDSLVASNAELRRIQQDAYRQTARQIVGTFDQRQYLTGGNYIR